MMDARLAADRLTLLATLRRVRRRLRIERCLEALGPGSMALVFTSMASAILSLSLMPGPLGRGVLFGLWWGPPVVFFLWQACRPVSLAQAAGAADRRADLRDELKSAYAFSLGEHASPWQALQIRRAARSGCSLDLDVLFPPVVPRTVYFAGAVVLLQCLILWAQPNPSGRLPEDASARAEQHLERIEVLVREAAGERRPEPSDVRDEEDPVARLDETLKQMQQGETSMAEGLRRLEALENRLTESELRHGALRESLETMGRRLEGSPGLDRLAEALREADLAAGADALRDVSHAVEDPAAWHDLLERLESAAREGGLESVAHELAKAATRFDAGNAEEARRALENAARGLESVGKSLDAERRLGEAGRELGALRDVLASLPQLDGARGQPQLGTGETSDDEARAQGALASPGDMTSSSGTEGSAPSGGSRGSGGGQGLGTGGTGEDKGAPSIELQVELEMELLQPRRPPFEEAERQVDEIRERASGRENSRREYRNVAGRSRYEEAEVLGVEAIPWRYRSLIKQYFMGRRAGMANDDSRH